MKLNNLFSDHAVFPKDTPLVIWGTAFPDAWISGRIGENAAQVQAASDGSFVLRFAPIASYGPVDFSVTDGSETISLQDVQIGEVWLAAGQSNMGFTLSREIPKIDKDSLNRNDIRIFHVPEMTRLGGTMNAATVWRELPPTQAECNFTAVGFHFAEKIADTLGCAVGIIQASFGGASIASFLKPEKLLQIPSLEEVVEKYYAQPTNDTPEKSADPIAAWLKEHPFVWTEQDDANDWLQVNYDDSSWIEQELPDPWDMVAHDVYGIARYRKTIEIPESWRGAPLELSLGIIDHQDTTWFNGVKVGATGTGMDYTQFAVHRRYSIPPEAVLPGTVNLIAVRPISFISMMLHGGLMGPAEEMTLTNTLTGEIISLAGQWRFQFEQEAVPQITTRSYQSMGAGIQHSFSMMYDNLLKPLIPYPLSGVLWYQGEADSTDHELLETYHSCLNALQEQFWDDWNNIQLPFLIVQLPGFCRPAPYGENGLWADMREIQLKFMLLNHSHPAVTADVCSDPIELHYPDKRVVGERLARIALHNNPSCHPELYNLTKAFGPIIRDFKRSKHRLDLVFENVGDGLCWRDGVVSTAFYVEGSQEIPEPVVPQLLNDHTIRLESKNISKILNVHYGSSQNPGPFLTLLNSEGLPASPFSLIVD